MLLFYVLFTTCLSESDRMTVLMRGYGNPTRSFQEVTVLFNTENNNHLPISKSTVKGTVHRFEESRNVESVEVSLASVEDLHSSTRKVFQQKGGITKSSIYGVSSSLIPSV